MIPDWFRPIAEYTLREGLPETLRLAAISLIASVLVGVLLGTLMTLRFWPIRGLIRLYVEVWVSTITALRPELTPAEARVLAHATFGLMNSTPFLSVEVDRNRSAALLRNAALAALRA